MSDREKVIAGLTMLADRKNDNSCEGLKCCKIAEDTLVMLKEQEAVVRCKDCEMNNQCSIQFKFADPDDPEEWYCANGKRHEGR